MKMLKNIPVARQFAVVVALLWSAFLALAGITFSGMAANRDSLRYVHDMRMAQMADVGSMVQGIAKNRLELLLAFQHDPEGPLFKIHGHAVDQHLDALQARRKPHEDLWTRVKQRASAGEGAALYAEIDTKRKAWIDRSDAAVQRIRSGDYSPPSMAAFLLAGRTEGEGLMAALNTLHDQQAEAAASAALAADARHSQTIVAAVALALLLGVPGLWLTWALRRRLRQGLAQADQLAHAIASGDLSGVTQAQGRDEIAQLLQRLEAMRLQLGGVIAQVRTAADGIQTASSEVAAGNADLSARTERTASDLQQTASAAEQLGATVRQNASSSAEANALAQAASEIASRGGQEVAQVVQTMRHIDQSARQIADITGVIDGIAFQTNILALNAAVEAARAGEQGRGFAVVASEVRSLAQRSAAAAKEISGLIQTSVSQAAAGSQLVDRAGQTMDEVVTAIGKVSGLVAEISVASAQQSDGVSQVVQAVQTMDSATQQNAALVEQSSAAADSLSGQARHLVQAVAVFRLT